LLPKEKCAAVLFIEI